uniref:Putative secreted protein n=1 Tax=Anopheles marajoara TaxID=58244 RepID=A0A2M4CES0_9DIPT
MHLIVARMSCTLASSLSLSPQIWLGRATVTWRCRYVQKVICPYCCADLFYVCCKRKSQQNGKIMRSPF